MQRYPPHYQMMEHGAARNHFPSAGQAAPEEATLFNVALVPSQVLAFPAGSSLLNLGGTFKRKQKHMEYPDESEKFIRASSEDAGSADDELRADGRKPQLRKKVSEMSPEQRLQWSRVQSRDHSRRSRQRRKKIEEVSADNHTSFMGKIIYLN